MSTETVLEAINKQYERATARLSKNPEWMRLRNSRIMLERNMAALMVEIDIDSEEAK